MKKLFSISLLIVLSNIFLIQAQTSDELYDKMISSIMIGLEEEGLKLAIEIISETKHAKVKEKTLYFISTYLFEKAIEKNVTDNDVKRAYIFLMKFKNDFPNSDLMDGINYAINFMEDEYNVSMLLRTMDDYFRNQFFIVSNKLDFANDLIHFNHPNPLDFFSENEYEGNATDIALKYFGDIITNNPEFELIAYYYKILVNLALFRSDIISSGLFDLQGREENIYFWDDTDFDADKARSEIIKDLEYLNSKYPSESITLDLNLIIAKMYLDLGGRYDESPKPAATKYFKHVLENDKNKLGYRYLLVKEFVLNNNL